MSETNYDARIVVGGTSSPYTLTEGKTYTAQPYGGDGAALYVESDGSVTGSNITFSGNTTTRYSYSFGGAIYNSGTVSLSDAATFSGNTAYNGGAIYNGYGGTLTSSGSASFSNNMAEYSGGAIYNSCTISLASATFSGNTVGCYGGAIYNGGTLMVSGDASFSNNKTNWGGAIWNTGMISVSGSVIFSGNTAGGIGGAILNSGTVTLAGATFSGNTAGSYCGASYMNGGAIDNNGTVTISGSASFSNNTTCSSGGAIWNSGTVTLAGATFSGNTAGSYGGAICNAGTVNLTGNAVLSTWSDSVAWDITGGTSSYATISGYSYLQNDGNAELTILVKDEQACGEYTIASGVESDLADNKKTFTLRGDGSTSASITVGDGSVEYGSRFYSLNEVDDNLVLTVGLFSDRNLTGYANIQPMYGASSAIFIVNGNTVTKAMSGDTVTLSVVPVDQFEVAGYTSKNIM